MSAPDQHRSPNGHRADRRPTSVGLVATYPPTACGLATFTSNLRAAIAASGPGVEATVVRVLERWEPERSRDVVATWVMGDGASLRGALRALNSLDAVVLQHEYGIFGGLDGEDVLALTGGLEVPLVAVLHTVALEPSRNERRVLEAVLGAAAVVVVQSEAARQRLIAVHGAGPADVLVIPHGAAANFSGPLLDDVPRPAVLTWGLLSPGKGIEHGIAAVARLASVDPSPYYVVAGRTHPKVQEESGEQYRRTLQAQARSLGLDGRVRFDDAYRDWPSLRALVRSVDVVLLPYDSRDHVSSGVLVEALASGKPVVATSFPHARELLAGGAGIVVDHGDVGAIADGLRRVLTEPGLADRMAAAARRDAGPLLWPAVGARYRALVDRVAAAPALP